MIPVAFDYLRPSTVEDAITALGEAGEEAKLLAGGQSLLPALKLRRVRPGLLIDLGGLPQLRGVHDADGYLSIGALTTHAAVAASPLVHRSAPLLALAAAKAGDRQVRHLGTLGGALAHAHPAGDPGTVALTLDARLVLAGQSGRRTVPVSRFATDAFTTVLGPDEILVDVRVPRYDGWGCHYEKFARMAQSWATVGVAVAVRVEDGTIAAARVALSGMGPYPVRAREVEEALVGEPTDRVTAAAEAAGDAAAPPSDPAGSARYRRHLARVLTARAVVAACAGAPDQP